MLNHAIHLIAIRQLRYLHTKGTEDNAPPVAQLVRLLGGLPLAIELAATRLPILSPDALLQRIQASGPLILGGPLDAPDRHRSLRSAFTVSYELLEEDQQAALRPPGSLPRRVRHRGGPGHSRSDPWPTRSDRSPGRCRTHQTRRH